MYRLTVDNRELGKFRSSGIIIATGTGSTGWLYSAKSITAKQVNQLKKVIGMQTSKDESLDLIDYQIA